MSGFRYVGPGRFHGIPTRDLTDAEFCALPPLDRRKVRESGKWVPIPDAPAAPPPPPPPPDPPGPKKGKKSAPDETGDQEGAD